MFAGPGGEFRKRSPQPRGRAQGKVPRRYTSAGTKKIVTIAPMDPKRKMTKERPPQRPCVMRLQKLIPNKLRNHACNTGARESSTPPEYIYIYMYICIYIYIYICINLSLSLSIYIYKTHYY